MMGHRSRSMNTLQRIRKLPIPMYLSSTYIDDVSPPVSPSRFASTNRIVEVPVGESDKYNSVNDWVATGGYSLGCPTKWRAHPQPIRLLAEYSDDDQAYPPYRPGQNKEKETLMPQDIVRQVEIQRRYEKDQVLKRSVPGKQEVLIAPMPPAPEPIFERKEVEEEYDVNNSNEMNPSDFIDESEVLVYDPWIMYLYPPILTAPDNNDPFWVDSDTEFADEVDQIY